MQGLSRQRIGLFLGPALFVAVLLVPIPASMADAARAVGAAAWAPMVAFGTLLWVLVWWVTGCMPLDATPTEAAMKLALRTQQIIAEETGVASVVDPLGGSWYVEALTDEIERRVLGYLGGVGGRGGGVPGVGGGLP